MQKQQKLDLSKSFAIGKCLIVSQQRLHSRQFKSTPLTDIIDYGKSIVRVGWTFMLRPKLSAIHGTHFQSDYCMRDQRESAMNYDRQGPKMLSLSHLSLCFACASNWICSHFHLMCIYTFPDCVDRRFGHSDTVGA